MKPDFISVTHPKKIISGMGTGHETSQPLNGHIIVSKGTPFFQVQEELSQRAKYQFRLQKIEDDTTGPFDYYNIVEVQGEE